MSTVHTLEALALLSSPTQNPGYGASSVLLYAKLTTRGELVTIAAPTGVGKSMLASNCCASVIARGGRVVWVNFDMPEWAVNERLVAMLFNRSPEDLDADFVSQAVRHLKIERRWLVVDHTDLSGFRSLQSTISTSVAAGPVDLIVLDGVDRLCGLLGPIAFNEDYAGIATAAQQSQACIIATSQARRGSAAAEIIDVEDLAFTAGKAQASSVVVTLGTRVANELRTLAVVKDRHGCFADQEVFRLVSLASLRLEVMAAEGFVMPASEGVAEPVYVNCDPACTEPAVADRDDDGAGCGTRLYHGNRGYVSVGRRVFESAAYQSRDFEALGRLLSLYEMAAIMETRLQAPGTRIPVVIQRGEVLTSLTTLGNRWGLDKKAAWRWLIRLEQDGLIRTVTVVSDGRGGSRRVPIDDPTGKPIATVVRVCHYDGNEGANPAFGKPGVTLTDTTVPRQ